MQNYGQGCLDSFNCQQQIVNVDSASSASLYMLSTVAAQAMVSVNGDAVVAASANANGFAETLTAWTPS